MGNVTYHLYSNLKSKHPNLALVNVNEIKSLEFWRKLLVVKPAIVHYIPGPTLKALILLKIIKILINSKIIISATHPTLPRSSLLRLFSWVTKPDIVLVQSEKSERYFNSINFKTIFVPNGVDTDKFVPIDSASKNNLRMKYGFKSEDFITLHIGPIKSGRNQSALLSIQNSKILLIVSITNPSEQEICEQIRDKGRAIVWQEYFPNIEEIYQMSDVYVWPVFRELHGIEIPLSVLESMACNLPVITTRYGGLNRLFREGEGLIFIESEDQIQEVVTEIQQNKIKINTRIKITGFSWKAISDKISDIYNDLLGKSN
jgi:glycosyltransferase involved in cell wall biosynthesis